MENRYNRSGLTITVLLVVMMLVTAGGASAAFESGSSCSPAFYNSTTCKLAFNPTVNTVVDLPPNGILDYTTVTIPSGVTVSFKRNAANTPVVIRTSGDVRIEGTISVNGGAATHSGTAGDGLFGDDGQPGLGGPGGFDGGMGGLSPLFGGKQCQPGGAGQGPGGGGSGGGTACTSYPFYSNTAGGGGGGGYGAAGGNSWYGGAGGPAYGQASILPIIGGSGGGGGGAGASFNGGGGGGGGGAILIASSGTIFIGKQNIGGAGRIVADGGAGGYSTGDKCGGGGGGGSGGGIRLVAQTITRIYDAYLYARGARYGDGCSSSGEWGGTGRIRMEANGTNWSGYTDPGYTFATPGKVLVPNSPSLRITQVGTQPVPANPTGVNDVALPENTTKAMVYIAASNIPIGTTVTIYVVPAIGANRSSALSSALDGVTDEATTATAEVNLSPGNNVLIASATYTVTELLAAMMPKFGGEYVAKIRVESEMGGNSRMIFITASGKEYLEDGKKLGA